MKKILYIFIILLGISTILGGCAGRGKSHESSASPASPVGTYVCNYPSSERPTVITLYANGSATMMMPHMDDEFRTYWDYAGKNIDVRIRNEFGRWIFMDFDEHRMYNSADDYRSLTNGNIFIKK